MGLGYFIIDVGVCIGGVSSEGNNIGYYISRGVGRSENMGQLWWPVGGKNRLNN